MVRVSLAIFLLSPSDPSIVVYNDHSRRPDPQAFSKLQLWHSDVSYERQPPSTTSLLPFDFKVGGWGVQLPVVP